MLQLANYSTTEATTQLDFLQTCVVPFLGKRPRRWGWGTKLQSFMTDDGMPIELSWSWTGPRGPVVRYSFEVMNRPKRSRMSPWNCLHQAEEITKDSNERFLNLASHWCNGFDRYWYNLIQAILVQDPQLPANDGSTTNNREGLDSTRRKSTDPSLTSQIFWAVDLVGGARQLKVYHVLDSRAQSLNCSKADLAMLALRKLSLDEKMWRAIEYSMNVVESKKLEVEMLSYDCVDPSASRIKVYFRSRKTSFRDVMSILRATNIYHTAETLNDEKLVGEDVDVLRQLWRSVITPAADFNENDELPQQEHRTAGILFYYEFKPGSETIRPKVYLPVRHYGRSDAAIARGIHAVLEANSMMIRAEYVNYESAIHRIW
jgi:DMATS type aromatic prenyltransferase